MEAAYDLYDIIIENSTADDTINNDVPRRSYTHRRITATPYFREGGFYDNHAHIRWTSSNFLHSAHWT
ncbi:20558_t:CDS:2, partial [Rhizophagus irregularis]